MSDRIYASNRMEQWLDPNYAKLCTFHLSHNAAAQKPLPSKPSHVHGAAYPKIYDWLTYSLREQSLTRICRRALKRERYDPTFRAF